MLLICYPKCTTCKRAENWLKEKVLNYTYRDIKLENPSFEDLQKWLGLSGLPLKRFFNTSGMVYRSLGLKDKLGAMNEEDQLKLLATDGMLVRRPILVGDDFVLVGFKEKEWEEKFS